MTIINSINGISYAVNLDGFEIDFSTEVDMASIKSMSQLLDMAFDYYKFNEVNLKINSPGGQGYAMNEALKAFDIWRRQGKSVNVSAGHCCASAAAILLAHGAWGHRTVEPTSEILFHFGRMQIQNINLTRERATSFAQKLALVDRQMVSHLVSILCKGAGDEEALRQEISARCEALTRNWDKVHADLCALNIFAVNNRGPWLKTLATASSAVRFSSTVNLSGKFSDWLTRHLNKLFEDENLFDLKQAYALCLIDCIQGVLPHQPHVESQNQVYKDIDQFDAMPIDICKQVDF